MNEPQPYHHAQSFGIAFVALFLKGDRAKLEKLGLEFSDQSIYSMRRPTLESQFTTTDTLRLAVADIAVLSSCAFYDF